MNGKDESHDKTDHNMNLDAILVNELGQFGWFQIKTLLLGSVVYIFGAWAANEYVFSTARIATRCYIPECDADDPEFRPAWLLSAIPGTETSFASCQRFANASTSLAAAAFADTCPDSLFDRNELVACDELLYENTKTVVYDFNLGCNEWQRSLIGSTRLVGKFIGLFMTGVISDRWGRRTALVIGAWSAAWLGLLRYFTKTYVSFIISEFVEAIIGAGVCSTILILLIEVVGPKYRVLIGATTHSLYSIGQIILGIIAWNLPNWRHLTLALYMPQLISIAYIWIITESVRWHLSKGHYDKSEKILHKIAKDNGKVISQKSLKALRDSVEENNKKQALMKEGNKREPLLIVIIFRHKEVLLRCIVCPLWWITMTFIYFGMSLNAVNLSGNSYVNYISVCAAQIPGYFSTVFLMDRIGRKPTLIAAYWICAACQMGYVYVSGDQFKLSLILYLVGTCCSAAVMTALNIYTIELFPTKHRQSLVGFCSTIGRIGAILAPLSPSLGSEVWAPLPYLLYAGLATLSGALVFLTPETLGSKFPDTIEEAADIGKKINNR